MKNWLRASSCLHSVEDLTQRCSKVAASEANKAERQTYLREEYAIPSDLRSKPTSCHLVKEDPAADLHSQRHW